MDHRTPHGAGRDLILIVCSGNICRSPMAEALAREILTERGVRAEVASAGTLGFIGHRASQNAVRAMELRGIDIEGHRSQPLTPAILKRAKAVVVMSPEHERAVRRVDPPSGERVVRLWERAGPSDPRSEIPDPVGEDLETFLRCRDLIERCLERWLSEPHSQM